MCLFLQVPMPLFSMELSHPAKEVIFNLAIYPVKTSIWQDCFNCPACEQQWKSVFIKRVSTVWTARPGIRGLKSASAPDSVITPVERPRCFKHPLNDFHTHTHTHLLLFTCEIRGRFVCWASQVAMWKMNPLTAQPPNWQPGSSLDLPLAAFSTETTQTPCLPVRVKDSASEEKLFLRNAMIKFAFDKPLKGKAATHYSSFSVRNKKFGCSVTLAYDNWGKSINNLKNL